MPKRLRHLERMRFGVVAARGLRALVEEWNFDRKPLRHGVGDTGEDGVAAPIARANYPGGQWHRARPQPRQRSSCDTTAAQVVRAVRAEVCPLWE